MKVNEIEDLKVWVEAKALFVILFKIFENSKVYFLKDQILRASLSICNNLAEGFERKSNSELIQFFSIAKGSAGEVRGMLHICLEIKVIDKTQYDELLSRSRKISVMIYKFIDTVKSYPDQKPRC